MPLKKLGEEVWPVSRLVKDWYVDSPDLALSISRPVIKMSSKGISELSRARDSKGLLAVHDFILIICAASRTLESTQI